MRPPRLRRPPRIRRPPRQPRPLPPDAAIARFLGIVDRLFQEYALRLVGAFEIREDARVNPDWRSRVRVISAEVFNERRLLQATGEISDMVEHHGNGIVERVARVNPIAQVAVKEQISQFQQRSIAAIKTLEPDMVSKIGPIIENATAKGVRVEVLAKQIQERVSVSKSAAQRIARTETLRCYAEVTRVRQTTLGIRQFIWRTSGDERVRASHDELEGQTFDWADPPVVDGETATPGMPIQCRCTPEPVIPEEFGLE